MLNRPALHLEVADQLVTDLRIDSRVAVPPFRICCDFFVTSTFRSCFHLVNM